MRFTKMLCSAALLGATAVTLHAQTPSSAPVPFSANDSASTGNVNGAARDKKFLRMAGEGGMFEIEASKLAVQKGNSEEVKNFGQKMVDDHTMLSQKMMPFMDKYKVKEHKELSDDHKKVIASLQSASGDDFDKMYIAAMVKAHHTDVRAFKQETASTGDADLRAGVKEGLDVITQHTMMIDTMAKAKGMATKPMPK